MTHISLLVTATRSQALSTRSTVHSTGTGLGHVTHADRLRGFRRSPRKNARCRIPAPQPARRRTSSTRVPTQRCAGCHTTAAVSVRCPKWLKLSRYHCPAAAGVFAHLFRYAIRLLGAWVAKARAAGADASIFRITTLRAPAETSVAVRRHRECSCRLLVTARGRGLGTRQAHGPLRCKGGNRQHYRDNDAQNKPHNKTSVFDFHVNAQRYVWDAGAGGDSSTS